MHFLFYLILLLNSFKLSGEATPINLVCPSDVWLPCGAEIWDLSNYGTAYYYINGIQYTPNPPSVVYDLTTCETGKIYRTWEVMDANWNIISCTQTIYISGGNFNYTNIQWPLDNLELQGCQASTKPENLPHEYARPIYDHLTCSMVGVSYKDQVFNFGPDCKKLLRTWTVLDWCNYYPGSNRAGRWTYTQTIKISNNNLPELNCPPSLEVIPQNCSGAYVSLEDAFTDDSACRGDYEIINNSVFADVENANASGFYPIGLHEVEYSMEYACGKTRKCQQEIRVLEKAPVPYCLSELNVALMPVDSDGDGLTDDGMVELWASDLDYGSFHPCYPGESLRFSFSSNLDSTSRSFTCIDVGPNELQIWVTDTRGNQSWCAVTVDIQNNAAQIPDCPPHNLNMVEGTVTDVYGQLLENVFVELKSRAYFKKQTVYDTVLQEVVIDSVQTQGGLWIYITDHEETIIPRQLNTLVKGQMAYAQSDSEGYFMSEELSPERKYVVSAFKYSENQLIDQNDLDVLEAYISGERNFASLYSYIAADINEDRRIDEDDLEILREIVSGEEDEWPLERQWLFYSKNTIADLPAEANPLVYELPQTIILDNNLDRFNMQAFIGIRKGDLDHYENIGAVNLDSRNRISESSLVYPNPFNEQITVNEPVPEEQYRLRLYDMNGRVVYDEDNLTGSTNIKSDASWQAGTYTYSINTDKQVLTGRLLLIR